MMYNHKKPGPKGMCLMKNVLKILCIILALCLLCSCSKVALDNLPDEPPQDTGTTPPNDTGSEESGGQGDIAALVELMEDQGQIPIMYMPAYQK